MQADKTCSIELDLIYILWCVNTITSITQYIPFYTITAVLNVA